MGRVGRRLVWYQGRLFGQQTAVCTVYGRLAGWQACGMAGVLVMPVRLNETGSPGGKFCLRVRPAMGRARCKQCIDGMGNPSGQSSAQAECRYRRRGRREASGGEAASQPASQPHIQRAENKETTMRDLKREFTSALSIFHIGLY